MGYLKALWKYFKTEKGRYDLLDCLRAIALMVTVMLILRFLLSLCI